MKSILLALFRTRDDAALLCLRLFLGGVMLPHGLQKTLGMFGGNGFTATMGFFTGNLGIPAFFAVLAIAAEAAGAIGLIVGCFTRIAALGVGVTIGVAAYMAHQPNGFFMNWSGKQAGEGFEYHLLVVGMALALVIGGAGKASIDRFLAGRMADGSYR